jgi:hypothetical protein
MMGKSALFEGAQTRASAGRGQKVVFFIDRHIKKWQFLY